MHQMPLLFLRKQKAFQQRGSWSLSNVETRSMPRLLPIRNPQNSQKRPVGDSEPKEVKAQTMQNRFHQSKLQFAELQFWCMGCFCCFFTLLMNQTLFSCHTPGNFVPQTNAIAALAAALGFSAGKGTGRIRREEPQKYRIYGTAYSSDS